MQRWTFSCERCQAQKLPCTRKPTSPKCDACILAGTACEVSSVYYSKGEVRREGIDMSLLKKQYSSSADLLRDVRIQKKPKATSRAKSQSHPVVSSSRSKAKSSLGATGFNDDTVPVPKGSYGTRRTASVSLLSKLLSSPSLSPSSLNARLVLAARTRSLADHLLALPDLQLERLAAINSPLGVSPSSWAEYEDRRRAAVALAKEEEEGRKEADFLELLTMFYLAWAAGDSPHSELLGKFNLPEIPLSDETGDWRVQGKMKAEARRRLIQHVFAIALAPLSPIWRPSEKSIAMLVKLVYTFAEDEREKGKELLKVAVSQFDALYEGADLKDRARLKASYLESIIQADNIVHFSYGGTPELSDAHYKKYYPIGHSIPDHRIFTDVFAFHRMSIVPPSRPEDLGQFFDCYWAALEGITRCYISGMEILDRYDRPEQAENVLRRLYELNESFRQWRNRHFQVIPHDQRGLYLFHLSPSPTITPSDDHTSPVVPVPVIEPSELSQMVIGMQGRHVYMLRRLASRLNLQFPDSDGIREVEKKTEEKAKEMFAVLMRHCRKVLWMKKSAGRSNLSHPFYAQDVVQTFDFSTGGFGDVVDWIEDEDDIDFLVEKMRYMSFRSERMAARVDDYEERMRHLKSEGEFRTVDDFQETLKVPHVASAADERIKSPELADFAKTLDLLSTQ
ncbi:hypothetical protein BT69DRAFT_1276101 [Atractiella rhizophila]|nr:hypothetical protein BT69DRAFT_1276101 [Atractiella rhizophila]